MVSMTGRVTMKGIARWAGKGGSYRTVQRFFNTSLSWGTLQWVLIRYHLLAPVDVIFMGGDDVVVTKSGKQTHGLDRFCGSFQIPVDSFSEPLAVRGWRTTLNRHDSSPSTTNQMPYDEVYQTP